MELEQQRPLDAIPSGTAKGLKAAQLQFMRELRKQFAARRRYEAAACVLGLIGILLMFAENEVLMSDMSAETQRSVVSILKWTILGFSVALDVVLVLQFRVARKIRGLQSVSPSTRNRFPIMRHLAILLELLLCGYHIPPGVSGSVEIHQLYGTLDAATMSCVSFQRGLDPVLRGNKCYIVYRYPVEAFGVFMIVRLYLLARFVRSSSRLYSQWVAFIGTLNDINTVRPFFHFKAIFKIRPLRVLVPLTALNILFTAAIIRILERPVQDVLENYWKAVWMIVETLSTTGFGDTYPVTYLGRAFTVVGAMLGGVTIIALIQSLFFGVLDLSPNEYKVKHLIDTERWGKSVMLNAAKLIQTAWRRHRHSLPSRNCNWTNQMFALMSEARQLRARKPTVELQIEDMVAEMESTVLAELERLDQEQNKILRRIQEKASKLDQLQRQLHQRKVNMNR